MPNPQSLIDKIKALPPERLDQVEDFVDFITTRAQDRALTRAAAAASAPSFAQIWNNPTTTPTMPFEFGDIVLVPFPFTNQTTAKKRPAVAVSSRRQ